MASGTPQGPADDEQMREACFHLEAARRAINEVHRLGFECGGYMNPWMNHAVKCRKAMDEAAERLIVIAAMGGGS